MVCSEGHGVLYLADSPANSLDHDHWSKLDQSWESLFPTSEGKSGQNIRTQRQRAARVSGSSDCLVNAACTAAASAATV